MQGLARLLTGGLCGLLANAAAYANPTGPTVVHGTVQFANPDATTLEASTSANAIINWRGFSINTAETTRFIQPSATSAVLNRVTGSDPSAILGRLLSNGRVFLVNPHGIVFGEGAVVDTAGLVASTLGIGDADFLAGRYRFEGGPDAGGIVHRGRIEAGADGVFLLAPSIENSGAIRTDGGDLVLAAGRTVNLTSLDLDGVQVQVQAPEDEVLNLGELVAERGAVGAFAGSIRNSGTIEANAVTMDGDGTVRLVAQGDITLEAGSRVAAEGPSGGEVHIESKTGTTWVSGVVSARASEGRGGTVRLLGRRVGLDGARVDASGPAGGGEVLVGGDESGEGPIPTADATYVSADSTVSADALDDGDGGKVVVFAERFANVRGRLSARGGPNGGNGGFVETSGRESFVILHTPDVTAPQGEGGHWLIDPYDITIVAGTGRTNITAADPFTSTGDDAQIGIDLITAALTNGASVTVQTGAGGTQDGDITLDTALNIEALPGTGATESTLTLDAHGDIIIKEAISDTAGGKVLDLVLDADGDVWIVADLTLFDGELTTEGDIVRVANGAKVTLDGATWDENSGELAIGADAGDLGTDTGTLVVRNGGTVTAAKVVIGRDSDSTGTVTVTGARSSLTTAGTDNSVVVGRDGNGTLNVLDGGLVDTLIFVVAVSGTGYALVSGVASDETRSRVIVSPANGARSGLYVGDAGFARVADNDGSSGRLEILGGGLFRVLDSDDTETPWFQVAEAAGSVGTVLIDGEGSSLEVIRNRPLDASPGTVTGPSVGLGIRGGGTTTIRNGGELLVRGQGAYVFVSSDSYIGSIGQRSTVSIESGGRMVIDGKDGRADLVIGTSLANRRGAADGEITVTGPGSRLAARSIHVGQMGTGRLSVLDGGLVEATTLTVATWGTGRLLISGVASDGTRSRAIVSPASVLSATQTAGVNVGGLDGSDGHLEILDGGLLRVLGDDRRHGPTFNLALYKGSVGTLLIDGDGSRLEVVQDGAANISRGPQVHLAARGGGTTTIRNGGTMSVRGEQAWVRVSRDSTSAAIPDPDPSTIDQPSVVRIESGGRLEIDGTGARLVIAADGPGADGTVTVTDAGSELAVLGSDSTLVVGHNGGKGRLDVHGDGRVRYEELQLGTNGVANIPEPEEVTEAVEEKRSETLLPNLDDETTQTRVPDETRKRTGDEDEEDEEDDEDGEDGEEASGNGEGREEETEELPMCLA